MTTAYVADTGVFVRAGGSDDEKYRRLRRAVQQAGVRLHIPRRVHEELGGGPDDRPYPSSTTSTQEAIDDGWVLVANELDYTNSTVSGVMDAARRFIANETDREEHTIEKADTALLGLAAQLLDTGEVSGIVVLTTDKPAGRAAETLLAEYGFDGRIEYRYVSTEYLEDLPLNAFDE
jgi:hypothetical protein